MEELKQKEVPVGVIIGAVAVLAVALLAGVFFAFIKPNLDAKKAEAEFSSPQAEAKRDPDQRKVDPGFASKITELRAKEQQSKGIVRPAGLGRRRE